MPEWSSFGAIAEVRLTAFGNLHLPSSRRHNQQPPLLDGLAPIYDYIHRRPQGVLFLLSEIYQAP